MAKLTNNGNAKTNATNANSPLERRKARRAKRGGGHTADWQSVDPEILQGLIAAVALHGTVTFGYTRDGGAYFINFWVDGASDKEYIRPNENVDEVLDAIRMDFSE